MKVLQVHNVYLQRGGEDAVFEDEVRLLQQHGHEVRTFCRTNREIDEQPSWRSAAEAVWSRRSHAAVGNIIARWQPDVLHLHNSFPLVSPAVVWAAARQRVAVVATLHNYRLACLEGSFVRDGSLCNACLGHSPLRGVLLGCYRGSRVQSGVLAASRVTHRALGTWDRLVHRFIALNEVSVANYVAAGLPAERIRVKPNFAWRVDDALATGARSGGLFVGRLAPEKGVRVLADALQRDAGLQVTVIGDGPERAALGCRALLLGYQPPAVVQQHMLRAAYLVIPSVTHEQFPRVLAEAYACGLPVLAAASGALARLVDEGQTGLHFQPGNAADLATKMAWADTHPQELAAMGRRVRGVHAELYSPERVYALQMEVYAEAVALAAQAPAA